MACGQRQCSGLRVAPQTAIDTSSDEVPPCYGDVPQHRSASRLSGAQPDLVMV